MGVRQTPRTRRISAPVALGPAIRTTRNHWPLEKEDRFMRQPSLRQLNPRTASLAAGAALFALPLSSVMAADLNLPPISVGAGIRTSFSSVDVDGADENVDDFSLNSARIYI